MKYNGIDMTGLIKILSIKGRGITKQELTTIRASGSDYDYVSYREKPTRYLEIEYEIRAGGKEELRKKIDEVSSIMTTKEQIPVIFADEPDRTYYVEYAGSTEDKEYIHVGIHRGTVTLLRDPYKYGPEKVLTFPADIVIIDNKGTVETEPVFELTAIQKTTFTMISKGAEEYNLIGIPTEVDEQVVDEKTLILSENGSTLDTWTSAGTRIDVDGVANVSGEIGTDNSEILPISYGTGSNWHGPALLKEISPIQDFEIEMRIKSEMTNPSQIYRIELYLFDENMNVLGKMAVQDFYHNVLQQVAEARYGDFMGKQIHYLISSKNYKATEKYLRTVLRFRRNGQRLEFYVAKLRDAAGGELLHYDTMTQVYQDVNNEYQGKLKYVQIHFGTHPDGNTVSTARITDLVVFEIQKALEDQTPYIMHPGDVIKFDHKKEDILINGEPRNDLKDFGGSFFKLSKGENMIMVTPENSFNTKITFMDKYE